jgi:hypothetical protein
MRLRRNQAWTEDDSERLKALVASGASAARAAAIFDRSIDNIRQRARMLGAPFPTLKNLRKKLGGMVSR